MRLREFRSELWLPLPQAQLFPFFADALRKRFATRQPTTP
jgi:hypothetical protein